MLNLAGLTLVTEAKLLEEKIRLLRMESAVPV